MKKLIGLSAVVAGALVATSAVAAEPGWTYAQAGYWRADSGDDATDGFRVDGSLGLGGLFHVQLEYMDGTVGDVLPGDEDSDFDGYRASVGLHPSVGEKTQAVLELQYFDLTYDFDGGADDDVDGYGVAFGFRHMMSDQFEVNAMATWNEGSDEVDGVFDEDFSDIALEIGARYYFNDAISAGVAVTTNDSIAWGGDSALIDVRWQFGDLL